ncbi:uncharacterized protein DUF4291 [Thermosporothrix hazakensis]|jgi:hypothetical protein|uniref:Uncharacterized protein DUF4291 n=1 Tax=Thermosporothrix hazakensis TaxID=644383 RepID=A0A326U7W7_THEHA|nr:DUF4291 domain-containing protein [Thermosporothrix hazakensis]PZW27377.1 uncharacterized protein DUF4291 [Thermosporothrix hazakensis]GCE45546.1 hypothetical protein KTH_04150 [Thermosporothrix hazakensis]
MQLQTTSYLQQLDKWPEEGRHILAQYDEQCVVVYQAYKPAIGHFAATHGYFGGEFRLERTSWIKPNFLWMMYRSKWGTSPQQEVVLAISLKRAFFDELLTQAVHSSYRSDIYPDEAAWYEQLHHSQVVLQWDPDHAPNGDRLPRRALQLGLRGNTLARYAKEEIAAIEDISAFVAEQRAFVQANALAQLQVPRERVYPAPTPEVAARLKLDPWTH